MSEFSPLRDPVFLLTWQVHLAVVTLLALLGIWAGMTRRPWYVAPTLLLALLWLFVPLEAPEPVVVLLLSVPVLAVACRIARRGLKKPEEESSGDSQSRFRFTLADLLWLTLIVGMLTALLIQVWRMPWKIEWRDTGISATSFITIGLTTLVLSQQRTWKQWLVNWTTLAVLILAAAACHYYFVREQWLLMDWSFHFHPMFVYPYRHLHVFASHILTFLEFALLIALSLPSLASRTAESVRSKALLRMVFTSFLFVLCCPLVVAYVATLYRPAWPRETFPAENGREALLAVLVRHEKLNPKGESLYALEQGAGSTTTSAVSDLFAELELLLARDEITLFDSRYDPPSSSLVNQENVASGGSGVALHVVEALVAQAKIDYWLADRHDLAIRYDLLALSLARVYQKRATLFDAQKGIELESQVMTHLTEIRSNLTPEDIAIFLPALGEIAKTREPFELTLLRDSVVDDRAADWQLRWSMTARRILGMPPPKHWLTWAFNTRDARLAMLRTDLALRSYRQTHGGWPESLERLVPDELPAVPIDPFSHQPLVYRGAGDDFTLYSWGNNRRDDSGRFGTEHEHQNNDKDIDLFLDAWLP